MLIKSSINGKTADIVIGRPRASRSIAYKLAEESLWKMIEYTNRQGYTLALSENYGANLGSNRNKAVDNGRKVKAKWLFTIDDDMMVPEDTIIRLMKRDKSVVSGLCVGRQPPCRPTAYIRQGDKYNSITSWNEQGLTEVDAVGAACCLIKMKVFDDIKRPYYTFNEWGEQNIGEDVYFCNKVKAAGIPIYIDPSISIGHIGDYPYSIEDYFHYKNLKIEGQK